MVRATYGGKSMFGTNLGDIEDVQGVGRQANQNVRQNTLEEDLEGIRKALYPGPKPVSPSMKRGGAT